MTSLNEHEIRALAIVLDAAQRGCAETPSIASDDRVRAVIDDAAAYRVQEALVNRRAMRGERVVGVVGRAGMVGRVTDAMAVDDGGAVASLSRFISPQVEPAVAYRLSATTASSLDEVSAVAVALVVTDSRYGSRLATNADAIADNASLAGFAIGEWVPAEDGELGSRSRELVGVLDRCRSHGTDLAADMIVLVADVGAQSAIVDRTANCTVDGLGTVIARFEA